MDMNKQGGGNSYFDIQTLCNEAVERNFRGDPNSVGSVISQATYDLVWYTFIKWCNGQIEVGRAINMQGFGIIGYQQIRDNMRILYVRLSETFLAQHQLHYKPEMAEFEREAKNLVMEPLTKPNFATMSKNAQVDKGIFQTVLQNIIHCIGELLAENNIVEIDLQEMGKFFSNNRGVLYDPLNKLKPNAPQGKQTVKALMGDFGVSGNQNQHFYSQQEAQYQMQMMEQYGHSGSKKYGYQVSGIQGDSPSRRFQKPPGGGQITKDLLGAGEDPLARTENQARNKEFSRWANDAGSLMKLTFKKPGKAESRFPPVIDAFSRTLAAPISSERHYFSVSHKIGTNFTPSAKGFYVDTVARVIKFKNMSGDKTKLNIVGNQQDGIYAMIEPADEQEEYENLIYPNNPERERRVKAREDSYARYRRYVENEISVDVIAPIRQYWLTHIIELIPGDLHAVEKERIEYLIDTMLNEINKDYFDSVRKSILDYILKNESEMKRLGIQQVLNQPIDWGSDFYKGIEPNEEWKHNVMMARMLMSENLCICSQATLELMKLWQDYNNYLFVHLPAPREEPVPLNDFLNNQEVQMSKVKGLLSTDWNRSAVDILREELENLDKDQTKTFFESAATLMANQVRELIEQSVNAYVDFIQRFKFDSYPKPDEIVLREYDADTPFEDNFISLKLAINGTKIDFESIKQNSDTNILDQVQLELEGIIDAIVKRSQNLPRPENTIARSDKMHLWDVKIDDELVIKAKEKISETLKENLETVKLAVNIYDDFLFILKEKERIEKYLQNEEFTREQFQAEIDKFEATIKKIRETMPFEIRMNMFLIKCSDINNQLCDECDELMKMLLDKVDNYTFQNLAPKISSQVKAIKENMAIKANDSENLVKFEADLEEVKTKKKGMLMDQYADMVEWLMMLNRNPRQRQIDDVIKPVTLAYSFIDEIVQIIETSEKKLNDERKEIENQLMSQKATFQKQIEETTKKVNEYKDHNTVKKVESYRSDIQVILDTLDEMAEEATKINKQEKDLQMDEQAYPQIKELRDKIKPYRDLWELYFEYNEKYENAWQKGLLGALDPVLVGEDHKRMQKKATELQREFEKVQKPLAIATKMLTNLNEFKKFLPIITALCNKGLKDRHKEQIVELIKGNDDCKDIANQRLDNFKQLNIEHYKNELEEISDTATKESNNEGTMATMKGDWLELEFTCRAVPEKESYILDGAAVEKIQEKLDDHIIKTQTMKGSPFAKFMLDSIVTWETMLMRTQDNLDKWLKVQATWMYLQPVFSSEDIINQMPVEGQKFKDVNIMWCNLMEKINAAPAAMTVVAIEDMGQILKSSEDKLETVQKGLNDYLESKRGLFPRFFFLSNEELLEILSETKEPLRVQPHLKKCFEGINGLKFDDEKKIHGMSSIEGEYVPFTRVIDPIASKGQVEDWLIQVEDVMIKSVKDTIDKSFTDYQKKSREKWVLSWAGQPILTVAMTFWTMHAEEAMKKSGVSGLEKFWEQLQQQLLNTVGVVRSDVSPLQRMTLEALIVLDVHAKDVIKQELVDKDISDPNVFAWLSQLRYYWEDNNDPSNKNNALQGVNVWVKIINNVCNYNYEYLGNSARLVITPLTDRCYRTLCGAIYLVYGGAPEGPAGTGKTETTKDLAKSLARQCVVFNCSDQLDYLIMGKFFKGNASCGCWICFDEFNRIKLEVLSVIAQQVQTIQKAIKAGQERFVFEGVELPIKHTTNCFITMNPGYAGRAELPDNLKALFRTVAMMVPNYTMIAEISLYSFGFTDAKPLSLKITTTYQLCSEQLSSQKHYDYGMRAVKSVLTAAGNLKKKFKDENESILVLRAINDVNLAKFLSHDLPLFKNITSDLFPGVILPEPDYKDLLRCMTAAMDKMNLQHHEYFIMKIIQLYEMILVRHGLMIVGLPFSGKTSCIKVLQHALTQLNSEGLMNEMKTHVSTLNPKSITDPQLYGSFDEVSHDWSDGVLAVTFRTLAASMSTSERRWMVFDGPVDAIWIENMNTVLDDNRKLCLMSGEVIQMSANMNMIFEPMDLAIASPATVSRCGMVYLQPHEMGWHHLYTSWKNNLPQTFKEEQIKVLDSLILVIVDPILQFLRAECIEETPTEDQNLVTSMMRIMRVLFKCWEDPEFYGQYDKKEIQQRLESSFVFASIWSICCSVKTESRKTMNIQYKKIINGEVDNVPKLKSKILPGCFDRGTIYDYCYLPETNTWQNWMDQTDRDKIDAFPKNAIANELIVTTVDTIRYGYMQEMFIMNDIPSLFVGPTGTGKTAYIQNVLSAKLDPAKWLIIEVGFSAQTHCNQVQDIVDMKLDKRRKDHFGPRFGMKCVVFVDDLNMPKVFLKSQPPIEILRQLQDSGGWYDRKDNKHPFRNIVDTLLVAAMGTPGGGKSFITPRFQRHFNIIAFANFDENSLKTIFQSILKWHFREGDFSNEVANMTTNIVNGSIKIYNNIQDDLKPTPLKSHYTFNLRDISKVICGMTGPQNDALQTSDQCLRLWAHETVRIFGDRLINNDDRMWMLNAVKECTRAPFGSSFDTVFSHLDNDKNGKVETLDEFRGLAWSDIMAKFGLPDRAYEEVIDKVALSKRADEHLEEYNQQSDKPMPLVLFNFAIEHLMRISRVLKQPGGHCLTVGVGGSGRQSLTRLASKISDFDVFQVEIKKVYRTQEWREDVKILMRQVGGKGNPTTFLFTDTQIKQESFLEDINNILNTGEVPNIFPADEKADVCELVRGPAKEEERCPNGSPQELFAYFLERCKKFLHIVLAFSPIGASLRNRIRDFPSIVNCTTIDWFSEWPPDALQAVAKQFLSSLEMDNSVREACAEMVQTFHTTTQTAATKFHNELRRVYYVTPTSYLELINTFKTLLDIKRKEVKGQKDRYSNGYDCLINTESKVNVMKQEIIDLQPILIQTGKETAEKLVVVTAETEAADKIKSAVSIEEADAQVIADEANAIKTDCETQLAAAIPALKAAEDAVNCISKGDIAILKNLAKPPGDVVMVTSVVCMFFGFKAEKVKDEANPGKKIDNWWPPSQKLLQDAQMLPKLINYDKEGISQELIDKIQPIITKENFTVEKLKNVSQVAMNMAKWVFAMDGFYKVNKIVKPKKEQLAVAEAKYAEVMKVLSVKQKELKVIVDKVDALKADLQATQDKKAALEAQVADCEAKLIRAESLISGLGGEKARWFSMTQVLGDTFTNLTGDVLISSGMIAYLGAFTSVYREDLSADWVSLCQEKEIPNSGKFSLERVLGDPVQIRKWGLFGLPNDSFSVENAIITDKTRRWPLFIDPQGQANKWIRNMEKERQCKIVKFSDGNYLKILESSISLGNPVMIENVGEEMDPAIEPLLQKQIVKKGNNMTLKLGDAIIEYSKDFKFYLTTKLRNPHYLPEVSTKVTLINFMITFEGLSDQLLNIVVEKEQPDLQTKKEALVVEGAKNKNKLAEIEDEILHTLQNSADILGDATGIEILQNAKAVSDDINKKQAIAEKTEIEIDEARTGYKPAATQTSGLFFCISDLANIDPMYQYSLEFFKGLFVAAIAASEQNDDLEIRLENLNKETLESLYRNICRSLFAKDKLVFSTMLAMKIMELRNELDQAELKFFLTGGVALGDKLPDCPCSDWMQEKQWGEIFRLNKLPNFEGFMDHFIAEHETYKKMYDSSAPQDFQLPEPWGSKLNKLQFMCVQRCIRPDLLLPAMANFVNDKIGEYFIVPPPFDLGLIFKDSTHTAPLIFVLSPGADPLNALEMYAKTKKKDVAKVSLGQGQGPIAEKNIEDGIKTGFWVVLQNCHLAVSWMQNLEKICEDLPGKKPHRDFRLWLTSYPSAAFPVTVLQNGVKMTNEPPKGLKANLISSYGTDPISNPEWFDGCTLPKVFRKMLFGLCFFHAYIQERKLFGPLGWNIKYQFNESDLRISAMQLQIFIDEYPDAVPLDAINYLTGECNYGGRVTDDKDRRLMEKVLLQFYNPKIYEDDDYKFSPSGLYYAPKHTEYQGYIDYINSLPNFPDPECFGFHENAAITKNQNEANDALSTILICKSSAGGGGGGSDKDAQTNKLCDSLLSEIPVPFDVKAAEKKYPISYNQSMNTVLTQELDRFNGLTKTITSSLKNLKKAIKGEVLLSEELESALNSLQNGQVPAMWLAVSFPSLKTLGGYMKDLLARLQWFKEWTEDGLPKVLWITRFFFTQGFLTGTKQNYARKYGIAIDLLGFDYEVVADEENAERPDDGVNVVGMYIEGAKWNPEMQSLDESDPKVLFIRCPMMLFTPRKTSEFKQFQCYDCPIYKTSERKGVLMTTGHSTNFVLLMRIPCVQDPSHWIIRGTAIIMSLDD